MFYPADEDENGGEYHQYSFTKTTLESLVTYYVLIVMELSTRQVQVAGITPKPDSAFMKQVSRSLTNDFDGFLPGKRFLIIDPDQKYTKEFRDLFKGAGTQVVRVPARLPNLNSCAERFVLSIKCQPFHHFRVRLSCRLESLII